MNFFEQELHRLVKAGLDIINPKFAGRACYGVISSENRVRIQFVTIGYADHYEALKATVLNQTDGVVDSLIFRFSDIWGKKPVSNPNFPNGIIPHIWTYNQKSEWYAYRPTNSDLKRVVGEVNIYLDVFTDRSHENEALKEKSVVKKLREAADTPSKASSVSAKNYTQEI